ncbi:MAG: hypothetical protein HOP10_06625 [Chitinophagaceae bacterium]|nr:hypothetical protein [Chitinophagaceae bacterium]
MKKYIVIISTSLFFVCCNNSADGPEEKEDTLATLYSWEATLSDSGKLEVKRSEQPGPDSLSAEAIAGFLNKRYPNVQLQIVRTSGDTLYMSIPEATYLTQQMGSSGPQIYFADVVYNLTEIPGIRYVSFDFEEGDHASPAVLKRDNFKGE